MSTEWDSIKEKRISMGTFKFLVTDRGQEYSHDECERRLKTAVRGTQRWFSRSLRTLTDWNDKYMRDDEIRRLRSILEDMTTYAEIIQQALDKIEGVNRQSERAMKLRNVAGRTPEEAAAFIAKADQLDRKGK